MHPKFSKCIAPTPFGPPVPWCICPGRFQVHLVWLCNPPDQETGTRWVWEEIVFPAAKCGLKICRHLHCIRRDSGQIEFCKIGGGLLVFREVKYRLQISCQIDYEERNLLFLVTTCLQPVHVSWCIMIQTKPNQLILSLCESGSSDLTHQARRKGGSRGSNEPPSDPKHR